MAKIIKVEFAKSCERCKHGAGGYDFEDKKDVICQYDPLLDIDINDSVQKGGIHPDCPLPDADDLVSREKIIRAIVTKIMDDPSTKIDTACNTLLTYILKEIKSMPSAFKEKGEG